MNKLSKLQIEQKSTNVVSKECPSTSTVIPITDMRIELKSKEKINTPPKFFWIGGFAVEWDRKDYRFDFEDSYTKFEIKDDGYLYMHCELENWDECVCDVPFCEICSVLSKVSKKNFTEIYYECFASEDQNLGSCIALECLSITFTFRKSDAQLDYIDHEVKGKVSVISKFQNTIK